ncbi:unnamed protein product [Peniophora sp. CBMAI 1063]|nr:unnamed protein product [Peniophora sp. CBMAI 1063]
MPLELHNFHVHIESDGKELPQYQVKHVNGTTVRCYIPSEAGKCYRVVATVVNPIYAPQDGFIADLLAEGKLVTGEAMDYKRTLIIHSVRVAQKAARNLAFAAIQTTDCEDSTADYDISKAGVIEVQMFWAQAQRKTTSPQIWTANTTDAATVNERSKIAGLNVTSLGESKAVDTTEQWVFRNVRTEPDAIFQFYHQPLAHLEAAGIIPKTRAPLALKQQPQPERPLASQKRTAPQKRPAPEAPTTTDNTKRRKVLKPIVKMEKIEDENTPIIESTREADGPGEIEALEAEIRAERFKIERMAAQEALERKIASLARARDRQDLARRSGTPGSNSSRHPSVKREIKPIVVPLSGETVDLTLDG